MVNSGYAGALRLRGFELFDKVVQSRPRIWSLHKVLAHQEALESGRTELPHGAGIGKAALGDFNETLRNTPAQFERACRIGAERAQVAVVDPCYIHLVAEVPELLFVVDFEQYFQPDECAYPASDRTLAGVSARCDQQDDVGSGDPSFANLVRVDDKIFAQDRYR